MITFKEFEEAINLHKHLNEIVDKLQEFRISLIESPLYDNFGLLFDLFISSHFTESGSDLVFWWIYEYPDNKELYLENDIPVTLDSIQELWDFMLEEKSTYFKDATDSIS